MCTQKDSTIAAMVLARNEHGKVTLTAEFAKRVANVLNKLPKDALVRDFCHYRNSIYNEFYRELPVSEKTMLSRLWWNMPFNFTIGMVRELSLEVLRTHFSECSAAFVLLAFEDDTNLA